MKKIYIYPPDNSENQYINIQKKAIEIAGVCIAHSLREFLSTDFFLLNWFETLGKNKISEFFKKLLKLSLIKLFKKKIFWVVHNKKPHIKSKKDNSAKLSLIIMKILLFFSDKIIILSDETKQVLMNIYPKTSFLEKKIYKIPHPNYIEAYPSCKIINKELPRGNLQLLYIGHINQYKNVDLLIDIINPLKDKPIELLIAGNCTDPAYRSQLLKSVKNEKIKCLFNFIPDNEICNLLSQNDVVVLPYDIESSLNSGTIFLAFSNKKTVISPLIGTLKEYESHDFFYSYEYNSPEDHKDKLTEEILHVLNDYLTDPSLLEQKGEEAFLIVKEKNSIEVIASLYNKLFNMFV
ncbi:glycosyltransferase family 4 protein [Breznakiella homolactica]|uniref:Glycosyltransferase family 4 protein n=1 Tax=Breznakiella homolactica TaxID=2798577 RepID=A0A7T7XNY5_9SPIR|nr:glycosyltransferase family 4 protein [Breznakiella homolactica]QQO09803.1 glycosyltransferase family 4 protein [Breznakiella homolactica]